MAEGQSYTKQLSGFYFSPKMRSFFTILYLAFFAYFVIFYFDNFIMAIKFILHTIVAKTAMLDITYLIWGSLFIISLIIPFSVSIYALCLPYEIYKRNLERAKKILLTVVVILGTMDTIIAMDQSVKYIIQKPELADFVKEQSIVIIRES